MGPAWRMATATGHTCAMAHQLIIVRHAKSDWSGDHADIDRPLSARGRRQAPEAGAWLAANQISIDLAVVSPAARAQATWELVAVELLTAPETRTEPRIYHSGDLLALVRELPESVTTVALVGHNPDVEDLVEELTGDQVRLKTSAVAVIELPGAWASAAPLAGRLRVAGRPPAPLA